MLFFLTGEDFLSFSSDERLLSAGGDIGATVRTLFGSGAIRVGLGVAGLLLPSPLRSLGFAIDGREEGSRPCQKSLIEDVDFAVKGEDDGLDGSWDRELLSIWSQQVRH